MLDGIVVGFSNLSWLQLDLFLFFIFDYFPFYRHALLDFFVLVGQHFPLDRNVLNLSFASHWLLHANLSHSLSRLPLVQVRVAYVPLRTRVPALMQVILIVLKSLVPVDDWSCEAVVLQIS